MAKLRKDKSGFLSERVPRREFVAKTERERLLIRWMWMLLNELDDVRDSYVPHATSCEERGDELIARVRRRFPELHCKFSKKLSDQLKTTIAVGIKD